MKSSQKYTQVVEPKVKATVFGHGRGWVFTPRDFSSIGDPRSVSMALTRLARKGLIRQLTRGLYDYPKNDPQIGILSPSIDAVERALSFRHGIPRASPASHRSRLNRPLFGILVMTFPPLKRRGLRRHGLRRLVS
jgi:hypothetical protein